MSITKSLQSVYNEPAFPLSIPFMADTANVHELYSVSPQVTTASSDGVACTTKQKNVDLGMFNNSNTPNIVGPGTYNFLDEVYPWVKQSYNIKYLQNNL